MGEDYSRLLRVRMVVVWWGWNPCKPGSISRVVDIAQDAGVAKLEIEDI